MVGRFVIRSRLGAGGMGEVYRADDTRLKRCVALKRIAPRLRTDEHYRQRFLKEAEHASRLSDQRIAGVYDVLEENDETFLVMEYVEGVTLRERLTGPFRLADFLPVAIQCAEALVAAHEKGVVHRDIKPENIMLTPKGQVKILDFGVAKHLPRPDDDTGSGSTASGGKTFSGTPAYMAPEVLLEQPSDQRADIFSLGVVLYEMLAGQHPFRTESFLATIDRILHAAPLPLSQVNTRVPESLSHLISRMLTKDPSGRPATALELLPDLRALECGEALPVRLPEVLRRRAFWKVTAAVIGMAVAILLLLIGTVPAFRERFKRGPRIVEVPQKKHLAVLPFAVVGGTPETAAFSKGLVETLNARLTQLTEGRSLQVVPASEVRAQGVSTLEQARREFGVNLVLEGSLQQSGEMMRVTYTLVDAGSRRQLRADTITAGVADPFAMEDRVVDSVLGNLEIELQPPEKRALAEHGTQIAAAYDDYLRGRGYLQDYQKSENVENAIKMFHRALERDPRYALAYAGLGEAYWWEFRNTRNPQWVQPAVEACQQAASINDRLAAAQVCLGTVHIGTGRYEQARKEFQQALALEPTSDQAYRGLASSYQELGKLDEAESTYRRAIELRPDYWANYNYLGTFYQRTGQFQKAAQMFEQVIRLTPANHRGYYNLGAVYYLLERWDDAEQAYRKSIALHESATAYSNLGTLYFFRGRFQDAVPNFEKAVALAPKDSLAWGNLADAYRWAPGGRAKAADAYQRAIALAQEQLKIDPNFAETYAYLGLYEAKTGQKSEAGRDIEKALSLEPKNPTYTYYAAVVYHLVGDQNRSLSLLKKAVQGGYPPREIRADPEWGVLRDKPAFQTLVGSP